MWKEPILVIVVCSVVLGTRNTCFKRDFITHVSVFVSQLTKMICLFILWKLCIIRIRCRSVLKVIVLVNMKEEKSWKKVSSLCGKGVDDRLDSPFEVTLDHCGSLSVNAPMIFIEVEEAMIFLELCWESLSFSVVTMWLLKLHCSVDRSKEFSCLYCLDGVSAHPQGKS